ncbi:DUF1217 domain-containing protein [Neokomagataea anthophila]|uniref:DUF1217 domain-containing protein n=1 Tax=Neokomagataea anthophila TaxID=2826925 RepID=A0ABS5E6M5_9PROT|nr:DUF1217 domain-containing protein [Neokomagataea anthophila]MBR0559563.1 DUF1217 domain-containing protein [Neokomagataea anthophila]
MSVSLPTMAAVPQYLSIVKDEQKSVQQWTKTSPQTQQTLQAFQKTAAQITTPDQLLKNYRALSVVLGAYGMSSSMGQTALLRQLMTQDPTATTSLASRGGNAAWKAFAKDFSNWSSSPLASSTVLSKISQNYLTNSYENTVQTQTPGLGNALYFTRMVTNDTKLVNLMADPKLLKVAVTVAGFDPTQFGALDFPEQQRLLGSKLDLKQLATPQGVQKFAQRYLALLQIHPEKTSTPASMLTLYGASGGQNGILSLFGVDDGNSSTSSLYSALL